MLYRVDGYVRMDISCGIQRITRNHFEVLEVNAVSRKHALKKACEKLWLTPLAQAGIDQHVRVEVEAVLAPLPLPARLTLKTKDGDTLSDYQLETWNPEHRSGIEVTGKR